MKGIIWKERRRQVRKEKKAEGLVHRRRKEGKGEEGNGEKREGKDGKEGQEESKKANEEFGKEEE
jgi:hypothetical protein